MYRYIIWDFDGTLFDTYPHTAGVYHRELAKRGISESAGKLESIARVSIGTLHRHIMEAHGLDDAFCAECVKANMADEPGKVLPYPGADAFCREVIRRGGENWLYTHRDFTAKNHLSDTGMISLFSDFVLDGDGFPPKPAPDGILALLARNHADPAEAIMIGDREIDCGSGINAGIHACLFQSVETGKTKATYTAHGFDDLADILWKD